MMMSHATGIRSMEVLIEEVLHYNIVFVCLCQKLLLAKGKKKHCWEGDILLLSRVHNKERYM